jgi:hypothetical protein
MARREIKLGRDSEAYREWEAQARRIGEPIGLFLPIVVEAHARRDLEMESRAPAGGKRDVSQRLAALPDQELVDRALRDLNARNELLDLELKPMAGMGAFSAPSSYLVPGAHIIEVREAPDVPIDFPRGYNAGVNAGFAAGHLFGALSSLKPQRLDEYPELGEVQCMRMSELLTVMNELERKRMAKELKAHVHPSVELDRRIALMGVGFFLQQNRVRVFGDIKDPYIRGVRQDEWPKQILSKKGDDLKSRITLAAGKIVAVLQDVPTSMPMSWIIERKDLNPDIAHMGLGLAVGEGRRVNVYGQRKELMVSRIRR